MHRLFVHHPAARHAYRRGPISQTRGALPVLLVLVFAAGACPQTRGSEGPSGPATKVELNRRTFDLARATDIQAFLDEVRALRKRADEQRQAKKDARDEEGDATSGKQKDWGSKSARRGLKELQRAAEALQKATTDRAAGIRQIQEVAWAVQSNFQPQYLWRPKLDLAGAFSRVRDVTLNAIGRGSARHRAADLTDYTAADLSRVDPKPSSFWQRPASIADRDLYHGFDRQAIPAISDTIVTYAEPHTGYGAHPSFVVDWNGERWKVKFGEECSSGPFGARIYWTLGFPVEVADYAPQVKVRWDRRILSTFNSRQPNTMRLTLFGLPLTTMDDSTYHDPFAYIRYAVLKDGSRIEAGALRERLFPSLASGARNEEAQSPSGATGAAAEAGDGTAVGAWPDNEWPRAEVRASHAARSARRARPPAHPEEDDSLYDAEFEKTIDYVVMKEANIRTKEAPDGTTNLGSWDYNYLDHPALRELRGMGLLDAWLDNWDVRWANTRLRLVDQDDGSTRLEHVASDLGALFGNSSGFVRKVRGKLTMGFYQNAPNDYAWWFTAPVGRGQTSVPIRNYMTIDKVRPFYQMNLDDARWMARLIGQLTENQLRQALIGSGYDAPTARLLLEKLIARRDRMIRDLGLEAEVPLLRPKGANRKLSYDPRADGPFEASLPDGARVAARSGEDRVLADGLLRTRGATTGAARSAAR